MSEDTVSFDGKRDLTEKFLYAIEVLSEDLDGQVIMVLYFDKAYTKVKGIVNPDIPHDIMEKLQRKVLAVAAEVLDKVEDAKPNPQTQ